FTSTLAIKPSQINARILPDDLGIECMTQIMQLSLNFYFWLWLLLAKFVYESITILID
ncbi:hypothetical protein YPPY53_1193, partial [Yersinia pestis PY-53]